MTAARIRPGANVAVKVPPDRFEDTVAFYRDALGFEVVEEDVADTPTLERSCSLRFGAARLWLDLVPGLDRTEVWFELRADDLDAARERLAAAGGQPCDEVEPFPGVGETCHWIRDPAGVVHLLVGPDADG